MSHIDFQPLLETPIDQIPDLLGALETLRVKLNLKLNAPAPILQRDELLDADEAAKRLGVSKKYIYRHHQEFAFARKEGSKLLFSSAGIDAHIRRKGR